MANTSRSRSDTAMVAVALKGAAAAAAVEAAVATTSIHTLLNADDVILDEGVILLIMSA